MECKHINYKVVRCLRVESWLFLLADGTGFILLSVSNINQYQPELLMDQCTPNYCWNTYASVKIVCFEKNIYV